MPGCVGQCTYYWDEGAGGWYPGGFNTCESGCACGPPPGQEGPYDGYVATVACEGTPSSTTTSSTTSSTTTSTTTTSSTTSSTTTSTTTTPCENFCVYNWTGGNIWQLSTSYCVGDCFCPGPPSEPGTYYGEEVYRGCTNVATTTTTSTAPPTTTTTTTGTGTTTSTTTTTSSTTTTTTTTEQPCTGTCTWRWYAELQKWIKVSGGNGTCSTGCSCSYPESNGTTDGETATPVCKRLTCTKCCGNANCCPMPFLTCCPTYQLKNRYYLTLIDDYGVLTCIGGSITLNLEHTVTFSGAGGIHYVYDIDGLVYDTFGPKKVLCANVGAYSLPTTVPDCNSTQFTNCNRNLEIQGRFFIKDYYIPPYNCEFDLRIYLNSHMKSYVFQFSPSAGWTLSDCHLQAIKSDGNISDYGVYDVWHQSGGNIDCATFFPVNYEASSQVKICSTLNNPGAPPTLNSVMHYGAVADGTIRLLVTE